MYREIRTRLRKWATLLGIGSICLWAGQALMAGVVSGKINSSDGGDGNKLFRFLDTSSPKTAVAPKLASFLQCIGALGENGILMKNLIIPMVYCDFLLQTAQKGDITIDLRPIIKAGDDTSGSKQCSVHVFGAEFAPGECDDDLNGNDLRVRALPNGLIKRSVENGMQVKLHLHSENFQLQNFQLLVYVPGQNPICYILNYKVVEEESGSLPLILRVISLKEFFDNIGENDVFRFQETFLRGDDLFLRRIGAPFENASDEKGKGSAKHEQCCTFDLSIEGNIEGKDVTIDLRPIIGAEGDTSGSKQCSVHVFGAEFAPGECDDNLNGNDLRVRALPNGLIKRSVANGMQVKLHLHSENFRLLVFCPGQNPTYYISNYKVKKAASEALLQEFCDGIGYKVLELSNEGMASGATGSVAAISNSQIRQTEVLIGTFFKEGSNEGNLFAPIAKDEGLILSYNRQNGLKLGAPFCLDFYFHPYFQGEMMSINLPKNASNSLCAVNILDNKNARFAAQEGKSKVEINEDRSLPEGWLVKPAGGSVNVLCQEKTAGEGRSFYLVLFFPGENSRWCLQRHYILSEEMTKCIKDCLGDEVLKESLEKECKKVLNGSNKKLLQSTELSSLQENIISILVKNRHPSYVVKYSDEGCPKWQELLRRLQYCNRDASNGDISLLTQALVDAEPTGRYLYAFNPILGCADYWYGVGSALNRALFLSEELPTDSVNALREAYVTLAIKYKKSPEWIHRVLTLYLSIHPYQAFGFRDKLVENTGGDFVQDFFEGHCASVLSRHPVANMDESLVRLFFLQQEAELAHWKNDDGQDTFKEQKRKIFEIKDSRPDFDAIYRGSNLYNSQYTNQDYRPAMDAAKELFMQDKLATVNNQGGINWIDNEQKPSHVLWPYCLWKTVPIDTPLDVLKPYFPKGDVSRNVDSMKSKIRETWLDSGLLDCTAIRPRDIEGDTFGREGSNWQLPLNSSSRQKAEVVCGRILNRFESPEARGLRLMYALGIFLKEAKNNSDGPEWQAIQRATNAEDFDAFLQDMWRSFVWQTMDAPIAENRCLDGVYSALQSSLPNIIKPDLPADVDPFYLWSELALQKFRESFLKIFDSHISSGTEEKTYGLPRLQWKVNPIFGFTAVARPSFPLHSNGRDPVSDCLIPFKTGKFIKLFIDDTRLDNDRRFYSEGNKKNTSDVPSGKFKFTYIVPFSPVTVFYLKARDLFQRVLTQGNNEETKPKSWEQGAWGDIMKLAFTIPDARREYHAFMAGFPDSFLSEEQQQLWNPRNNGVPTSFNSIFCVQTDAASFDALNKHLRWWKVDAKGYFYPSFELWKYLAVELGYACWTKKEKRTDLASLTYVPPVPEFKADHDFPIPGLWKNRENLFTNYTFDATGKRSFYKHYNIFGERIDIDPKAAYDANDPLSLASVTSPKNPENKKEPVQPKEPEGFQVFFTPEEINTHADERQKLLYNVCYPQGQWNHVSAIREELKEAGSALENWTEALDRIGNGDYADEKLGSLLTGIIEWQELYGNKDALQRHIDMLKGELSKEAH